MVSRMIDIEKISQENFFTCKRFFLDTNFWLVIVCNRNCKDAEVKRSQLKLREIKERASDF